MRVGQRRSQISAPGQHRKAQHGSDHDAFCALGNFECEPLNNGIDIVRQDGDEKNL